MLTTGVDIVEIMRVADAVERHGERFLRRVYTEGELAHCQGRAESLAARFAAKEAAAKALGTGMWRNGVRWVDVEVVSDAETGAPSLHLHHAAAERAATLGVTEWSVSLTHDRERAIAFVVAIG